MAVKTNCVKNGKKYYRLAVTLGRNSEGKLIRKEFYGISKSDAEEKRDIYLNKINSGIKKDFDKLFLGKTINNWLIEVVKLSTKPSTFDRYYGIYKNYIEDTTLSFLKLNDVHPTDMQQYYNNLKKKGKTSSVIFNLNKLLRSFFNYAVLQDYIQKNPCLANKIKIPGDLRKEKKKIKVFEDSEIKLILNAPEDSTIKFIALSCVSTGMRRGECIGLKWNDIDYVNNEIHIRRSAKTIAIYDDNMKKHYIPTIQTTKTYESERDIPLPTSLINILNKIKELQNIRKEKAGESYIDNDLIFCNEVGELLDDSNLTRSFSRFLKRIGVEYKHIHCLRHTYATKQFENDIPLKTVSKLLGHKSIKITADTYTHVLKRHKDKTIDILSSV
ncbi:site-specific integrase [Clostridium chromiireducens]|uniref:Site-specific integrase n=1 Tax=Clostridium chromiireducens TaxID=225345 RepID=A0A399IKL6_9CLOT|nr:site-specific integrase [Clostridium chromiireducens]RII32819.1 site-specific integrase [Clostridium chromiireducens]